MRTFMLIVIFTFLIGSVIKAQNKTLKSKADEAWLAMPEHPIGNYYMGLDSVRNLFKRLELYKQNYRSSGLQFWMHFPSDARRFTWLKETVRKPPGYWKDMDEGAEVWAKGKYGPNSIDKVKRDAWAQIFPTLRKELFNSKMVTAAECREFKRVELYSYLESCLNAEFRDDKKPDLKKIRQMFAEVANDFYAAGNEIDRNDSNTPPLRTIEMIYMYRDNFNLKLSDLSTFTGWFTQSSINEIREWALKKQSLLQLQKIPMEFKTKDLNGTKIDLADLKGKVVLVDFWATWCKVCIAKMPQIKTVYDKYKREGFEVLSVTIDPEDNLDGVLKIKEKIGADWPTMIIGGKDKAGYNQSLARQIWQKYGFSGVPQLLLLDKNGLLVELNGVLGRDGLDPLVKQLIAKN